MQHITIARPHCNNKKVHTQIDQADLRDESASKNLQSGLLPKRKMCEKIAKRTVVWSNGILTKKDKVWSSSMPTSKVSHYFVIILLRSTFVMLYLSVFGMLKYIDV